MNESMSRPYLAATIRAVQSDNYRTKTFVLDARIDAQPGQFIMLWLPGFDEKPFSLVDCNPVTVMITAIGPSTRLIHEKRPGDQLWIRGPFGTGFTVTTELRHTLLVGGGYGVAPLLYLARTMCTGIPHISVAIGAQSASELLYTQRFDTLSRKSLSCELDLLVATDDGSVGEQGLVTESALDIIEYRDIDCIYACGPHAMLDAVRRLANEHRIPCQLSWEEYMRCGMGLCGSCEHEGQLLCMDGPVLSYGA